MSRGRKHVVWKSVRVEAFVSVSHTHTHKDPSSPVCGLWVHGHVATPMGTEAAGLPPIASVEAAKGRGWEKILNRLQLFLSNFLSFNGKESLGSTMWCPGLALGPE